MAFQGQRNYAASVNAAGVATIPIQPTGQYPWRVTQVSVEQATAPAGAICTMRLNGRFVTFLIATGDAAGGDPPVTVHPQDTLSVVWTGCTPNQVATALVFYDELDWQGSPL